MTHGEWRLIYPGVDYSFGTGATPVWNVKAPEIGTTEARTADTDRPRGDGRSFGVDYLGGQTLSFDLGVRATSDAEVRAETATFWKVWRANAVRLTPGAVAELRAEYAGRVRSVFGRPRRFSPDYSDAGINNMVSVLADFACVDDVFYGPEADPVEFGIAPSLGGGLIAPLAAPLATTQNSDRSQGFRVDSEEPVWPVVTLYGPITNAVIVIGDSIRWEVRMDLGYADSITIDTRPWARRAVLNGNGGIAGRVRGTRLSQASLPGGTHEVGLQGLDPTGTARLRLSWNPTYSGL